MGLPQQTLLRTLKWQQTATIASASFPCAYCGNNVASSLGYKATNEAGALHGFLRICPHCCGPTFFYLTGERVPESPPGLHVDKLPSSVGDLYKEARMSAGAGAYTASVMASRKVLMHLAVAEGAPEGKSFLQCVEYLDGKGFIPPRGKAWVDYVRTRGNEANHEIVIMRAEDALGLITFLEMLLKFIYEFPALVPTEPAKAKN